MTLLFLWRLARAGRRLPSGSGRLFASGGLSRYDTIIIIATLAGIDLCLVSFTLILAALFTQAEPSLLAAANWLGRSAAAGCVLVIGAATVFRLRNARRSRRTAGTRQPATQSATGYGPVAPGGLSANALLSRIAEMTRIMNKEGTPAGEVVMTDLPADAFPFTVELLDPFSRETVWSVTVDSPGALQIPEAADLGRERVESRITFADGTVHESDEEPG